MMLSSLNVMSIVLRHLLVRPKALVIWSLIVGTSSFCFPSDGYADSADDLLLIVQGTCLENMHDKQRVALLAKSSNWKVIDNPSMFGGSPVNGKMTGAWFVQMDDFKGILGTAESQIDGDDVFGCSFAGMVPSPEDVIAQMNRLFATKLLSDEVSGFQRHRVYILETARYDVAVFTMTGTHDKTKEVISIGSLYPVPKNWRKN
jgi:hypothetical protein